MISFADSDKRQDTEFDQHIDEGLTTDINNKNGSDDEHDTEELFDSLTDVSDITELHYLEIVAFKDGCDDLFDSSHTHEAVNIYNESTEQK